MIRQSFRPARPAPSWWNVVKTFGQMIVFWTLFLWVFPQGIRLAESSLGSPPLPWRLSGLSVAVLLVPASLLGVWSAWAMSVIGQGTPFPTDTARQLVVTGPYRYVRNPMAIAGMTQACGVGLYLGSWGVLAYVLVGGVVWNTWARPAEEGDLEQRFGASYAHYKRQVRCWIPTLTGYRAQAGA